eukprot:2169321-Rhodomonas_salina.4
MSAICLHACYAMSGTHMAYGATCQCTTCVNEVSSAICLRACYAMSGTDGACVHPATSGTDLAYATVRPPIEPCCLLPRDVRYWPRVCCYAMSGTDLADAATRSRAQG